MEEDGKTWKGAGKVGKGEDAAETDVWIVGRGVFDELDADHWVTQVGSVEWMELGQYDGKKSSQAEAFHAPHFGH